MFKTEKHYVYFFQKDKTPREVNHLQTRKNEGLISKYFCKDYEVR